MTLEDIVSHAAPFMPLALIGSEKPLARQIQKRLIAIGLLDPPEDGLFGPISYWALREFLQQVGLGSSSVLDGAAARALLSPAAENAFPVQSPTGLAGAVLGAMQNAGHWLCRHPKALNIVYVEGMDLDGQPNGNTPNTFNDARLLLRIGSDGVPQIVKAWEGTTEPGRYYAEIAPLDPRGAARIALGQFKAWSVGTHGGSMPHEALVQTMDIIVHRDLDRDYRRDADETYSGMFGINQHWGYDQSRGDIGKASAGCLVGRTKSGHREFMTLCKTDPRYIASKGYRFMTTVLTAQAVRDAQA